MENLMEKKIRRKFIYISMSAIVTVLMVITIALNVGNYKTINLEAEEILELISENDGRFPALVNIENTIITSETPYTTRYFSIKFDENKKLISIDTSRIVSVNSELARFFGENIISEYTSEKEGFFNSFKYVINEKPYGYLLIFLDRSAEINMLSEFLKDSVIICTIAIIAVYLLIIIFSKSAFYPIAESYKKQKQFVTDISHELKTPLAIIKVNTEVIEMENGQNEWSKSIHNQIKRLNELIQYLISLARLDENTNDFIKENFHLSEVVKETIESFIILGSNKNKELKVYINEDIYYVGDEKSIRLLLSILLENAIKYGQDNSDISIYLNKVNKKGKVLLQIKNKARGLEVKDYEQWFERFSRGDESRNSGTDGFGIGLAMARGIVQKMGGKINAKSIDGEEIIFTVEL